MTQKQSKGVAVARVNAEELYESQLESAVKAYNKSLEEQGMNVRAFGQDQLHNLRKFILQKMIERELLHQEALKKKVKVATKEIDQVMKETEKHYSSPQSFLDYILKDDLTLEAYRERVAYDMLINKIAAKRYEERKTQLSENEISHFYQENHNLFSQPESVHIGHILIKVSDEADSKEWVKVKKRLSTLKKSKEDFKTLAKKHSQCESKKAGGDLGNYSRGQLYPPLEIAAFGLKENEISEPVESREGVHLIKLYERRPQGFIPRYEEIKDQVETVARTEQAQKIFQEYIEELKKKAKIEIYEN